MPTGAGASRGTGRGTSRDGDQGAELAAPPAPRAVLYTRVSSAAQAEEGTSLPDQFAACTHKAAAMGARVVAHFEDAGVSGALYDSRPGMQAALAAVEAGQADVIIIANLSRFSRDREHQSAIKKRVEAAGARLVFCDMEFADTPEGDLAFGILGNFVEYERKLFRARTMRGQRCRAAEGIMPIRATKVYGYHIPTRADVAAGRYPADALGKYQIIEEEARWVREMFARCARGDSIRGIARHLNESRVPTARGGTRWYVTTVYSILKNPLHKGTAIFGKTARRTDESRVARGLRAHYIVPGDPAQQIVLEAPPIVDAATWELCQKRLGENQKAGSGNPERRYMLTGLLRCPVCGMAMRGKKRPRGDSKTNNYVCARREGANYAQPGVCRAGYYRARVLEGAVVNGCRLLVEQPEVLAAALEAARRDRDRGDARGDAARRAQRLRQELEDLGGREKAAIAAQIAGIQAGASPDAYAAVFADIAARRGSLRAALEEAEREAGPDGTGGTEKPVTPRELAARIAEQTRRIPEILMGTAFKEGEKNAFLRTFVQRVTPTDEGAILALRPEMGDDGQTVHDIRVSL